jgi:hypothetical protein
MGFASGQWSERSSFGRYPPTPRPLRANEPSRITIWVAAQGFNYRTQVNKQPLDRTDNFNVHMPVMNPQSGQAEFTFPKSFRTHP